MVGGKKNNEIGKFIVLFRADLCSRKWRLLRRRVKLVAAIENRFIEQYHRVSFWGLCPLSRDQKPLRFARMTAELHKATPALKHP